VCQQISLQDIKFGLSEGWYLGTVRDFVIVHVRKLVHIVAVQAADGDECQHISRLMVWYFMGWVGFRCVIIPSGGQM